jgi:hemerythrin
MDDIHKALVNHLNEVISCYVRGESYDKLQTMWVGTLSHTNTHFAVEEMMMEKFQYNDEGWGIHR